MILKIIFSFGNPTDYKYNNTLVEHEGQLYYCTTVMWASHEKPGLPYHSEAVGIVVQDQPWLFSQNLVYLNVFRRNRLTLNGFLESDLFDSYYDELAEKEFNELINSTL